MAVTLEERRERERERREKAARARRKAAARYILEEFDVKPGMQVHLILRRVSSSGMLRVIDPIVIYPDGSTRHIGRKAAEALGWTYDDKREGIRVGGCGMDMGFHLVHCLSCALFENLTDEERGVDKYGRQVLRGYELEHRWL